MFVYSLAGCRIYPVLFYIINKQHEGRLIIDSGVLWSPTAACLVCTYFVIFFNKTKKKQGQYWHKNKNTDGRSNWFWNVFTSKKKKKHIWIKVRLSLRGDNM